MQYPDGSGTCCWNPNARPIKKIEYARIRQPRYQVERFVVEHEGLYKRLASSGKKWDSLSCAKVYKSRKFAERAVAKMGYGKVVEV